MVRLRPVRLQLVRLRRPPRKNLLSDVLLVCKALGLPVLEPLGHARLCKLTSLALGCAHMAVAVTAAVCIIGVTGQGKGGSGAGAGALLAPSCWEDEGHLAAAARVVEACVRYPSFRRLFVPLNEALRERSLNTIGLSGAYR